METKNSQVSYGLNKSLDEVCGRILNTKPLPNLQEVFAEVRREESRKQVMMGPTTEHPFTPTRSALIFQQDRPHDPIALVARGDSRQRKGRPWCDHCHKTGHTKDTCWKLHGKPTNWKPATKTDRETRGTTNNLLLLSLTLQTNHQLPKICWTCFNNC